MTATAPYIDWNAEMEPDANLSCSVKRGVVVGGEYHGRIVRYRSDKHTICMLTGGGYCTIAAGHNDSEAEERATAIIAKTVAEKPSAEQDAI